MVGGSAMRVGVGAKKGMGMKLGIGMRIGMRIGIGIEMKEAGVSESVNDGPTIMNVGSDSIFGRLQAVKRAPCALAVLGHSFTFTRRLPKKRVMHLY